MKNKISIWLSSIALFFALLAVGFTFFRTTPMKADWMGILVGILALLTTILLGWQISSYVGFKKDLIRDIKAEKEKLHKITCGLDVLIDKKIDKSQYDTLKKNEYYMGGLMNYFEGYTLLINNSTLSGRFGIVYLIMTKAIVSFFKYGNGAASNIQKSLSNLDLVLNDFESTIKRLEKGYHSGNLASNFKDLDLSHNDEFIILKTEIFNFGDTDIYKEYIKMFLDLEKRRENLVMGFADIDIVAKLEMKERNDKEEQKNGGYE